MRPIDAIVDYLTEHELKIATAECGAGGLIVSELLRADRGHAVVEYGVFAQSLEAKDRLIGVGDDLRRAHGATSDVVVVAMVQQILKSSAAHIVIANPNIEPHAADGASPCGRAVLGWGLRNGGRSYIHVKACVFEGDRFDQRLEMAYCGLREAIRLHGGF